jgi:hypothetical protein
VVHQLTGQVRGAHIARGRTITVLKQADEAVRGVTAALRLGHTPRASPSGFAGLRQEHRRGLRGPDKLSEQRSGRNPSGGEP